jgi:hypothetical protein
MAGILLMQQPAPLHPAFSTPRPEGKTGHSHWAEDSGFAVLPAVQHKNLPQFCVLSGLPNNKIIPGDVRPGPTVYTGSVAAFQDKFPRWSSSTFM